MPRDDHEPDDPAAVPPAAWPVALTADLFARAARPLPAAAAADPARAAADASDATALAAVAADLTRQFAPRDPAEELLVAQMIWTHARVLFLTRQAGRQTDRRWFTAYSAELTRASHLYRRQMQALSDHRRPRRSAANTSFTTIRQANIAAQQLVQTGAADAVADPPALSAQASLPPVRRRPRRPASGRDEAPPVDAQHRPADAAGQGDQPPERVEARPVRRRKS